jgi:hypothetical protein
MRLLWDCGQRRRVAGTDVGEVAETLGFGRITTGNGQVAPAVPRVALREAGPSSEPIAITGFRP